MAFLTSENLILLFVFLSSLNLLLAATSILHLKKNFISAFGKITVPISLPSIQTLLYFLANFV
jgi:hypothetical protein